MSEFKSGDIVVNNGFNYTYACIHPYNSNLSIVLDGKGEPDVFSNNYLHKPPKTHTVNGFEVPEPVCAEEYEKLRNNQGFFCFDANDPDCCRNILAGDISIAAVKCGFVFKTESDIRKNIAALQGIDPSTVE